LVNAYNLVKITYLIRTRSKIDFILYTIDKQPIVYIFLYVFF
jgi:hypothetical protein